MKQNGRSYFKMEPVIHGFDIDAILPMVFGVIEYYLPACFSN